MKKLVLAIMLTVPLLSWAGEVQVVEEDCLAISTTSAYIQAARKETGFTMEEMMVRIVKNNLHGEDLGAVLVITSEVYNRIDITMPPAMVADVVLERCLKASIPAQVEDI